MTNLEWLNSLSAEQLASIFNDSCNICILTHSANDSEDCYPSSCEEGILKWLRSEHKE